MMTSRSRCLVALALLVSARVSAAEEAPAGAPPAAAIAEADARRPWLGVHLEMNEPQDWDEDEKPLPGAGFISVFAGGPAQRAGLQWEDRVLRFEGREIRDVDDLRTSLGATKPGQAVKVTVLREGKEVKLQVVMGTMPAEAELQRLQQSNGDPATAGRVRFRNAPARPSESTDPDRVALTDGNRLEGKVQSLSTTELVLTLASGRELTLDAGQVASVRLAANPKPQRLPVAVLLRQGGWLLASQIIFDGDLFRLTLEDGGLLELRRSEVEEVSLSAAATPAIYRGPQAGDGWQSVPENNWAFRDGAWQNVQDLQGGRLARKFTELPGAMEFSFDASIPPQGFCALTLYAFRSGQAGIRTSPGAMQIPLLPGPPNLTQCSGDTSRSLPATAPVQDGPPVTGKPVRYTILSDREKGTLIILVDGVVWNRFETDKVAPEDLPRAGRVIEFAGMAKLKISQIALRPWTGQLPTRESSTEQDWIACGDEGVAGEIVKITPHEVTLAGGRTVPRTQPVSLRLKTANVAAPAGAGGVWVETNHGSAFAADSVTLIQGRLVVRTAFAQEYQLPREALRSLDFRRAGERLPAGSRVAPTDVLTLPDGRQLTGKFVPPLGDGHLLWKIAAARQPLDFAVKDIASILLASSVEAVTMPQSVVRLRNGDWLPADVVGSDAGAVLFKTPFSERLTVSRGSIQSIYTPAVAALVSDGATGRQRWKETDPARQRGRNDAAAAPSYGYQDGGYSLKRSSAGPLESAGLLLPIPEARDAISVEFNVTTPHAFLTFQLMDKKGQTVVSVWDNGNNLQIDGDEVRFSPLGKVALQNGNTRVQLVLDPGTRSMHLALNGQQAGTCQLKKDVPWVGIASLFLMPWGNSDRHFRVSDVWVAPWRGSFADTPPAAENQVRLSLANGDEATGALLKLDGATVEIDSPAVGRLSLPVSRVRALEVHAPAAPAIAAYRVRLYDRGLISASALRITGESVVLQTELGELHVPLIQVKEIVFAATL